VTLFACKLSTGHRSRTLWLTQQKWLNDTNFKMLFLQI
jgi:hypothetical protein